MKIVIAATSLHQLAGGAERQAIMLANELAKRGHDVHLLSRDSPTAIPFYKLDEAVNWHRQDYGDPFQKATWLTRIRRALGTRRLMKRIRPDLVVCFQFGVFIALKSYCLGQQSSGIIGPIVAAERISPQAYDFLASPTNKQLKLRLLSLADHITVQCASYVSQYPRSVAQKITVVPNPVPPARDRYLANAAGENNTPRRLLCVGRLCFQKNQAVLVDAFALLAGELPDWQLEIVGDGADEETLRTLVSHHGLEKRVSFHGVQHDIPFFLQRSHLFCLPSRWEGFPNALSEALAHGLPAVGFKDCMGINDLIQNGINGVLADGADDAQSLSLALGTLMKDDGARRTMGLAAAGSVAIFQPKAIYDHWERTLVDVAEK